MVVFASFIFGFLFFSLKPWNVNAAATIDVSVCVGGVVQGYDHGAVYWDDSLSDVIVYGSNEAGDIVRGESTLDCVIVIEVPLGQYIQADIVQMRLYNPDPRTQDCYVESLTIGDVIDGDYRPYTTVCGSWGHQTQTVTSVSNRLWLKFHTTLIDDHTSRRRRRHGDDDKFEVEFQTVNDPRESPDGCDLTLQGDTGSLSSPHYPSPYPADVICTWVIIVPSGKWVVIETESFNVIDTTQSCEQDYIEIREGTDRVGRPPTLKRVGRYCNKAPIPEHSQTTAEYIWIQFSSDSNRQGFGFILHWQIHSIDECHMTLSSPPYTGYIISPGYPETPPRGIHCVWRLLVLPHQILELNHIDVDIQGVSHTSHCSYDYLGVYIDDHMELFCGRQGYPHNHVIQADDEEMVVVIEFSSQSGLGSGFRMSYDYSKVINKTSYHGDGRIGVDIPEDEPGVLEDTDLQGVLAASISLLVLFVVCCAALLVWKFCRPSTETCKSSTHQHFSWNGPSGGVLKTHREFTHSKRVRLTWQVPRPLTSDQNYEELSHFNRQNSVASTNTAIYIGEDDIEHINKHSLPRSQVGHVNVVKNPSYLSPSQIIRRIHSNRWTMPALQRPLPPRPKHGTASTMPESSTPLSTLLAPKSFLHRMKSISLPDIPNYSPPPIPLRPHPTPYNTPQGSVGSTLKHSDNDIYRRGDHYLSVIHTSASLNGNRVTGNGTLLSTIYSPSGSHNKQGERVSDDQLSYDLHEEIISHLEGITGTPRPGQSDQTKIKTGVKVGEPRVLVHSDGSDSVYYNTLNNNRPPTPYTTPHSLGDVTGSSDTDDDVTLCATPAALRVTPYPDPSLRVTPYPSLCEEEYLDFDDIDRTLCPNNDTLGTAPSDDWENQYIYINRLNSKKYNKKMMEDFEVDL